MADTDDSARAHLHQSIQASTQHDEEIGGAVLIGWVCVAEWMHPTGDRWLSRLSGSDGGDRNAARWQMQGYLHNALNDWPEGEYD
jgi:hypothetical protein